MARILVLEDSRDVIFMLEKFMQILGHKCQTITPQKESLEELADIEKPDLILSDLYMGEVTAVDCLAILHQVFPKTPIIVHSGAFPSTDNETIVNLYENGMSVFLAKPVQMGTLKRTINITLHNR